MSYNFKKIMDLDLVTEVPEGANVLIETDGATKRLPSTAINNGYSKEEVYNKTEADNKFLTKETIAKPDLSQNDPNAADYVKNRTHYEETTTVNEPLNITWNGNTEGLVSVEGIPLYKISDLVLTEEQLKACTAAKSNGQFFVLSDIWADGGIFITEDLIGGEFGVFVARKDGAIFSPSPDASLTFPESGIYFAKFSEESFIFSLTSTEPVEHTKTVVHKLDPKFLPDGYPYEEVVVTPVTAFEFELEATDTDNPHKWFRHEEPPYEFDDMLAVLNSENVGKTVCVNYDGVQYMCDVHMDNHFSWYIGNSGLMKNFDSMYNDDDRVLDGMKDNGLIIDTGEPFLFLHHSYYTVYNYIVASDTNPHNVEVGFCDTVVKKLDKKFLPDDIGGGGALIVELTSEDGHIFTPSVSRQEALDAIMAGKNVYLSYPDDWKPVFVAFSRIDMDGYPEWVDIWCGNELGIEINRYTWLTDNAVELTVVSGNLNKIAPPM